ncbi:hypothetical protein ACTWP5_23695 [Streptomyces sp. 4N509B]|uniref:hypothetical protein n=1 Tax=Streptomyces sp. 4N509B TaxID=3457413 RepID=UPI003FD58691
MHGRRTRLVGAVLAAIVATAVLSTGAARSEEPAGRTAPASTVAPDHAVAATAEPAAVPAATAEALATIQQRIADHVAANGTEYTFGSFVDHETGRIVLETDAPADLVAELTALPTGLATAGDVEVHHRTVSTTFSRRDDTAPFWGAAGITDQNARCSSGYAVRDAAGGVSMVTAGHCFGNGATVWTESLNLVYGTVFDRRLPPVTGEPIDVERVGGQSYAGFVYSGGVNSTTAYRVSAAGPATVGFADYCHSGRTTGEHCGHTAVSIDGQVCTEVGCTWPVIVFNGGTQPQPGDSGGPFYVRGNTDAFIRGHVIAGSGVTSYATPWTEVERVYGVSIVTG